MALSAIKNGSFICTLDIQRRHRNIFIDEAELTSSVNQNQLSWNVKIRRNFSDVESSGEVKAFLNSREIAKSNFSFESGEDTVEIQIYWPWDKWIDEANYRR